jgi:hypothetical protein
MDQPKVNISSISELVSHVEIFLGNLLEGKVSMDYENSKEYHEYIFKNLRPALYTVEIMEWKDLNKQNKDSLSPELQEKYRNLTIKLFEYLLELRLWGIVIGPLSNDLESTL